MTRRIAISALFAATLSFAQDSVKKLSADDLKQALEKKDTFLLDVREPKELQESGAVKGYVNIPLGQLESRLSEIPKDKTIVTLCMRGVRATRAAEILTKNGYKIGGACGITDWKAKQYPVVYPKS